ncbi:MAG: hypothetical protein WBW62_02660 [Solirubrobacterales bacterium]
MILLATVVNWSELLQSVVAGAVAAILLTIVVSLGIRGTAKYVDYNLEGRTAAAIGSLAVGAISLALTVTIIVFGLVIMVAG